MSDLTELCLEVTTACHSHCNYCSNDYSADAMISLDEAKKIIDDFAELNGKILELSGGEPLLHPDIVKIIKYAKQKNLQVMLYTSGNICRKGIYSPISDEMANKLKNAGLDMIFFNLEGSRLTHDAITGIHNGYNNVMKGIEKMLLRDMHVGVHFVPTKMNYKDIPYVMEMCLAARVCEVDFLRFVQQGRGKENRELLALDDEETLKLNKYLERAMNMNDEKNHFKVVIGHPFTYKLKGYVPGGCPSGITTCLIKPTGVVVPCPAFKGAEKMVAGNIKEASLKDVWNNSLMFKQLRENKSSKPRCC